MDQAERGRVHIYHGDGKGKTTAAVGLAVRAAGRGKRVLMARFLKTDDSGEVSALQMLPGVRLIPCEQTFGFYFQMTQEQKREAARYYGRLHDEAWDEAAKGYDMLILDEIMAACGYCLVEEEALIRRLGQRPDQLEVVMTGRNPPDTLLNLADYVTEMVMRRHPYEQGIGARLGIEY